VHDACRVHGPIAQGPTGLTVLTGSQVLRRTFAPGTVRRALLAAVCGLVVPAGAQPTGAAGAASRAPEPARPAAAGPAASAPAGAASRPAAAAQAASGPPRVQFEADSIRGRLEQDTVLQGHVVLRRDPLTIEADRIEYSAPSGLARARGDVRVKQNGDLYTGSYVQMDVQQLEGFILDPTYRFERTQAGGHAQRVDFLGRSRVSADGATYTSCPAPPADDPDAVMPWEMSTRHIRLNFEANEGVAEAAVVRFYGVPILAAPVLTFPVTDERKSGWLPPSLELSNTRGLEIEAPYYWNIAPNLDATLTPGVSTRRGVALTSELRYLQPRWSGEATVFAMPNDRVAGVERPAGGDRWASLWTQEGHLPGDTHYDWHVLRVSDDEFWKDGLHDVPSLTPRLLSGFGQLQRRGRVSLGGTDLGRTLWYARVQRWQVLQDRVDEADPLARFDAPYQREPQLGLLYEGEGGGFEWSATTEVNRFIHEDITFTRGNRAHMLLSLARPFGDSGWRLTPRLSANVAGYDLDRETPLADGRTRAKRAVGTFSLDSAWSFERQTRWRNRAVTQTLEPRLLFVRTPFRDQTGLPNFDSAPLDFNATTVFSDNAFSGIDRVSDAHQVTGGLTTRLIDAETGAEAARFGIAQRYLLRDQLLTPDGAPLTQRSSDILLMGSTTALEHWTLDGTLQHSPEIDRLVRTIASARYSPGPFRTVNATYRLQRGVNEQLELGWQWPLSGLQRLWQRGTGNTCGGTLYSVGRVDYNLREKRIADSILGLEYDSGCWVGRIVAQRQSTALDQATNKLSVQLELVGLSRLAFGANPLRLLKDNIPGYQMLRDEAKPASAAAAASTPATGTSSSPSSVP
jgi:LPS-assembly protein